MGILGTTIGRYAIEEELGQGGMSVVYRGVDQNLERDVAIKVLHAHLARKQENRRRLLREAKAIARLKHINILEVYDFSDEDAEQSYIVMEYVRGQTLREFVRNTHIMPPEYAALVGIKLTGALGCAHNHKIIHRDLKPENVMVTELGEIKLMDFGIAHVFDAETMTQTGSLLGSPAHMAPEMIEGDPVDERADIFALGTVLYWLVTGALPFDGKSAPQILRRVLEGLYKNPEAVDARVGKTFADIIRKCLAHEADDRYANVEEAQEALEQYALSHQFLEFDTSLTEYFLRPEDTRVAFEANVVSRLLDMANHAMERANKARAFCLFNRILAYDPANAEVQQQLMRLHGRDYTKPIAVGAATICLVGLSAFGYTFTRPPIVEPQGDGTAIAAAVQIQEREHQQKLDAAMGLARERTQESVMRAQELQKNTSVPQALGASLATHLETRARAILDAHVALASNVARARIIRRPSETRVDVSKDLPSLPETPQVQESWKWKFDIFPFAAKVSIGDKKTSALMLKSQGIELQKNAYDLVVTAPYRKALRKRITVRGAQSGPPEKIDLKWQDGIIKFKSNHPALVQIYKNVKNKPLHAFKLPGGAKQINHKVSFSKTNTRTNKTATQSFIVRSSPFGNHDRRKHTITRVVEVKPGTPVFVDFNFRLSSP